MTDELKFSVISWWIPKDQNVQVLPENSPCTNITLIIHTNTPESTKGVLALSVEDMPMALQQNIHLLPCPFGFEINKSSNVCDCAQALSHFKHIQPELTCDIQTQTISQPYQLHLWMGSTSPVADLGGFQRFHLKPPLANNMY